MKSVKMFMFLAISCALFLFFAGGCTSKMGSDEVQKRGDLYYLKNSEKIFSGLLFSKIDAKTNWYEKNIKDGKLDGKTTLYFQNGQKLIEMNFKNGLPNGDAKAWFSNGVQHFTGNFKDGQKDGPWEFKNDTNQFLLKSNYLIGKRDGKWTEYYKNGKVKSDGTYKNDLKEGEWSYYYSNGTKVLSCNYQDGKKTGKFTLLNPTNKAILEGEYTNGLRSGMWKITPKDCERTFEIEYINGIPILDAWDIMSDFYKGSDISFYKSLADQGLCISQYGEKSIVKNILLAWKELSDDSKKQDLFLIPFADKSDSCMHFGMNWINKMTFAGKAVSFFNRYPNWSSCGTAFEGGFINNTNNWVAPLYEQNKDILKTIKPDEVTQNYIHTVSLLFYTEEGMNQMCYHAWSFKNPKLYALSQTDPLIKSSDSIMKQFDAAFEFEKPTPYDDFAISLSLKEIEPDFENLAQNTTSPPDCEPYLTEIEQFIMKSNSEIEYSVLQGKNSFQQANELLEKVDVKCKSGDPVFMRKYYEDLFRLANRNDNMFFIVTKSLLYYEK